MNTLGISASRTGSRRGKATHRVTATRPAVEAELNDWPHLDSDHRTPRRRERLHFVEYTTDTEFALPEPVVNRHRRGIRPPQREFRSGWSPDRYPSGRPLPHRFSHISSSWRELCQGPGSVPIHSGSRTGSLASDRRSRRRRARARAASDLAPSCRKASRSRARQCPIRSALCCRARVAAKASGAADVR